MNPIIVVTLMALLFAGGAGGVAYAFLGAGDGSKKRVAALAEKKVAGGRSQADANKQRRQNVTALLKDLEKQQAEQKVRLTLRRRLEQAGLNIQPRTFYMMSAGVALAVCLSCQISGQSLLVSALAGFAAGFGVPRWVLSFMRARRLKKFTAEFANSIDVIVRSVKSGLPTTEALKIVAKESPAPVGPEFSSLVEGLKIGVSLEQGLKRMFERIPTSEVSFFGIVMTIQQKSGGNLSEALGNLASVLRDRKRLQGKIKAMSSEAKASAMIIGSLPPGVMGLVYLSSPDYIMKLFTERMGNLMLAGCVVWMGIGVFVMNKMISFKH
ncbi:MAG TPA: type II secretion system F family protein [Rhizomicrobium sp.]|nr:type II secretion system F family protein [Rhizomicrobium sp.]